MTINWGVFLTPEFVIGVVVVGLILNVIGAYLVRSLDWVQRFSPHRSGEFENRNQRVFSN